MKCLPREVPQYGDYATHNEDVIVNNRLIQNHECYERKAFN